MKSAAKKWLVIAAGLVLIGCILFGGVMQILKWEFGALSVRTDTGNVVGSLLIDKIFIAQTDTGKVDVPKSVTDGRCAPADDRAFPALRYAPAAWGHGVFFVGVLTSVSSCLLIPILYIKPVKMEMSF